MIQINIKWDDKRDYENKMRKRDDKWWEYSWLSIKHAWYVSITQKMQYITWDMERNVGSDIRIIHERINIQDNDHSTR